MPAVVIASRGEAEGGVGKLRTDRAHRDEKEGKRLFRQTCWSCHNLDAVQAQGVTGPDLDDLGLDRQRVLNAIKRGGTGDGRMPAGLLQGEEAAARRAVRDQGRRPVANGVCGVRKSRRMRRFSVRRFRSAARMPASKEPKPAWLGGAGEPVGWPTRPGANRGDPRSATLSARARQLTPQAIRKRPMTTGGARALREDHQDMSREDVLLEWERKIEAAEARPGRFDRPAARTDTSTAPAADHEISTEAPAPPAPRFERPAAAVAGAAAHDHHHGPAHSGPAPAGSGRATARAARPRSALGIPAGPVPGGRGRRNRTRLSRISIRPASAAYS